MIRTIKRFIIVDKSNSLYWSKQFGFTKNRFEATSMSKDKADKFVSTLGENKIASAIGAEYRGPWQVSGGYFGALQASPMFKVDMGTLTVEPVDITFELHKK